MKTEEIKKSLTLADSKGVTPCIDVVFYVDQPLIAVKDSIARLYALFLEKFENDLTHCSFSGANTWKKATKINRNKLLDWIATGRKLEGVYVSYDTHSGVGDSSYWSPLAPGFSLFWTQVKSLPVRGKVRISFPIDYPINTIEAYIKDVLEKFPIVFGYAGYGLLFDEGSAYNKPWTKDYAELHRRYPGINFSEGSQLDLLACKNKKICEISWYTILGAKLLQELGGVEAVKTKFDDRFKLVDVNDSLCIVAGRAPDLGHQDVSGLPLYCEVGKHLKAIAAGKEIARVGVAGMKGKEGREWFLRFFPE